MFPQTQFADEIVRQRLEEGSRSRLVASSRRRRRASRRSFLRRLAATLSATTSADECHPHPERFIGRQV